ncbi:hypothetical protein [Staphylococcus sp. GDX8P80P]|uniref:hypothetical protein n=1 Tax=Staphylococcus sp. GDX8P80P TaxID=2804104 RepID=UPI00194E9D1D|nr:hypothetical protein [Staphylococcus sp. GDX8P80P]
MKKKVLLIIPVIVTYYLIRYKGLKEANSYDSIDIESEEDLLEKMGLIKDIEGNIHEIEK